MKRGHGDDGYEPSKRQASGRADVPRCRHAFKVLITDSLAAGLLGTHGSVKDEIQQETGARLVFSNRNDYFPDTKYRVMGIYSDDPGVILDVFSCMMPLLIKHGDDERKSQPSGQTDLCGKEHGEYIFRFILTRRMQSQIVGTGGSNIKFIRQDSGAKVFVENESILGHRAGKVIGTPNTILAALRHVNEFVQCESEFEDEFYHGFARIVNFAEAEQRGWEPPPEPKDLDKPVANRRASGKGMLTRSAASLNAMPKAAHHKTGDSLKDIVPPPPAHGKSTGRSPVGEEVESLAGALESFPAGTVKLQYSMCCEVPAACVGLLVGTGGEAIRQAEQASGAKIEIERSSRGESRTMTLVGTLLNIYVAHAIMMSRLQSLEDPEEPEPLTRAAAYGAREDLEEQEEQDPADEEPLFMSEHLEPEHLEPQHLEPEHLEPEHLEPEHLEQDHLDEEDMEAESDEDPDVIREQIAKLEEKLARALARRAGKE